MNYEEQATTARWNLSELYEGASDVRIFRDLQRALNKSVKFRDLYRGKFEAQSVDPALVYEALKEYERIHLIGMKPYLYATLLFSSDTRNETALTLLQQVKERWVHVLQNVTFFTCELMELPDEKLSSLASDSLLSEYRHFLLKLKKRKPYRLSEAEEKIASMKNLSGRDTFLNFYSEFLGTLSISLEIHGKMKDLSLPEAINLFNSPDARLREKAMLGVLREMENHGLIFKTMLNALILDHKLECSARGHPFPMHRMLMENEVDNSTADMLMELTEEKHHLARSYLRKKARLLPGKTIRISDVYAPAAGDELHFDLYGAREVIAEAMASFYEPLEALVLDFFEKGWIDAEIRKGKKEGAFCTCFIPSVHPYISVHFGGKLRDLLTLAHELGHGMHFSLASKNSYLNFMPPFVIGEAIATFTELVVAHHLISLKGEKDAGRQAMASLLDNFLLTVFRQALITRFEREIHDIAGVRLPGAGELCHIWWGMNRELYGNVVEIDPAYRWGWACVPHIFRSHFYCFSYVFGGLLAHAMYRRYERLGHKFARRVIKLMESGGSLSTGQLLGVLGAAAGDREFWDEGFRAFEELLKGYSQN